MTQAHALLLNADYQPIKVISWERAFSLLLEEKVDLVVGYAKDLIRSVSLSFEKPAVVRLREFYRPRNRMRFNRQNVLARDGYTCAYCGTMPLRRGRPDLEQLTLDHVIPRAQSKGGTVRTAAGKTVSVTCWENIVTACYDCNAVKADRTPAQAKMSLRYQPRAPSTLDALRMTIIKAKIPTEWIDYLPEGSGWSGYWTDELDKD
jgi:5-methylcytosine-specific restriction endonuclease McrA